MYSRLNSSNAILPRGYDLSKIHKNGFSLRIMISSTGSPLHCLAIFLQQILKENLLAPISCCRNSFDFISKDIHIPDGFALVSLDVTSFFTNVPINMVLTLSWTTEFDRVSYFSAQKQIFGCH